MVEIKETKKYDQFVAVQGNRDIDKYHVKRLIQSIKEDNQLHLHPIIVNADNEVVDGNHRLHAARTLGVPIFYIKDTALKSAHVITCNVNQKSWSLNDYLEYYWKKDKNDHYKRLIDIMAQTKLNPKSVMSLVLGICNQEFLVYLKSGEFELPEDPFYETIIENYLNFVDYCHHRHITPMSMFKNNKFCKAFWQLCMTTGFDNEVFFKKMERKWYEFKPMSSVNQWYEFMIGVYNNHNGSPLEAEYGNNT